MKIDLKFEANVFNYNSPIWVRNFQINQNRNLHIFITINGNPIAEIDFMLLPNFHPFDIDELQKKLELFFTEHDFRFNSFNFHRPFFATVTKEIYDHSFLFYAESILLKIFSIIQKDQDILNFNMPIRTNAFSRGKDFLSIGCRKIKIRPEDNDDCISDIVTSIQQNPKSKIRLDGNHQFTKNSLTVYLKKLKTKLAAREFALIEYIEEPFLDFYDYEFIFHEFNIPMAVDESLKIEELDNILKLDYIKAIIIKPSLIGISTSLQIIEKTQITYQKDCVISSTYEAGNAYIGHLFLAQKLPLTYHGLDTLHLLPKNLSSLEGDVKFIF